MASAMSGREMKLGIRKSYTSLKLTFQHSAVYPLIKFIIIVSRDNCFCLKLAGICNVKICLNRHVSSEFVNCM